MACRIVDPNNDPDHPAPEWLWRPGHVYPPEWRWKLLKVCVIGHCRYGEPDWDVCRVAGCQEPARRLLLPELSMYLLGGERAVMTYMAEAVP